MTQLTQTLINEHADLLAALNKARQDSIVAEAQVRAARLSLTVFEKKHGNITHKAHARAEWEKRQPDLDLRRSDPIWREWRERFLSARVERGRNHSDEEVSDFIPGMTFFFIHSGALESDRDLFFGPLDGTEHWIVMEEGWVMAHLIHATGLFPSVSQARKNGFNHAVPSGWSTLTVGKGARRKELFVLNGIERMT